MTPHHSLGGATDTKEMLFGESCSCTFYHVLGETLTSNCGSMIFYELLSLSLGLECSSFTNNLVETSIAFYIKSAPKPNHEP